MLPKIPPTRSNGPSPKPSISTSAALVEQADGAVHGRLPLAEALPATHAIPPSRSPPIAQSARAVRPRLSVRSEVHSLSPGAYSLRRMKNTDSTGRMRGAALYVSHRGLARMTLWLGAPPQGDL